MPTVRTTFRPDLQVEVDDTEYAQLKAQGLLVEDEPATEEPTAAPAAATKKTTTSGPAGSKES
ncbi:hypothetical protein M2155_000586 [Streptomyces sp. SAI-119]|uniref:hypothetical protein n=1 Tax=Streptomyces sp. SAI-119 TaxID=2940541 RepID=UPI0024754B83|nr:hypothetical protein [Streptomyces sp. SAI-119]MDH6448178.1 hypothetical protein [Streptomyces sp. SAI-119]